MHATSISALRLQSRIDYTARRRNLCGFQDHVTQVNFSDYFYFEFTWPEKQVSPVVPLAG